MARVKSGGDDNLDGFLESYKRKLLIDETDLDTDIARQAVLFHEVADRLAVQTSVRDKAKKVLSEVEARVDFDIRDVARRNKDKITEKEIATAVRLDDEVQAAHEDLIKASYYVGRLTALRDAFEQRRYMLREMAGTYASGYWDSAVSDRSVKDVRSRDAAVARSAMDAQRRKFRDSE